MSMDYAWPLREFHFKLSGVLSIGVRDIIFGWWSASWATGYSILLC